MRPVIQAIASIRPRAKPAKPAESRNVPCDPETTWGPGYDQTRVCTFNYGLPFQWECTDWVTVGGICNPIPPKPAEAQTIPCPEGYIGAGQDQTRVCTFNYSTGVWECTAWNTVAFNCTIATFVMATANQEFDPPLSGGAMVPDQEQTYGPAVASSSPAGYSMTLTYHVYVVGEEGSLERLSDLTVAVTPIPPVGSTLSVAWDRPYATFPTGATDATGSYTWSAVPNDEWTANESIFTVTMNLA